MVNNTWSPDSQEWALGLLHTKCMCGAIWLTNIGFKRTLDQVG